jgi:inorganic pyrophosphatase
MGCALSVRLIGAIEAEQKEKGEVWVRNDRLLAVATHAHVHANVKSLRDLDSCLLDEIEAFFAHYNKLEGKEFRVLDRCGPKSAGKLLEAARRKSENE